MQKKTVLVFDFDGTLWGSSAEAVAATLDELSKLGVIVTPALELELRKQWGMYPGSLRDTFFPQISDEQIFALFERINVQVRNAPYDGAADVLRLLKERGLDLYGLTSRDRVGAMSRLTRFGMAEFFTMVICSSDIGWNNAKPSAYGLDLIIRPLEQAHGLRRGDVLYVGDTVIADRQCAASADVDFVAVDEEKIVDRVNWYDAGVTDANIITGIRWLPLWLGIE